MPPYAQLYLDGETCGGLNDLFYVAAASLKQLEINNMDPKLLKESRMNLVTLTADSGVHIAAENHLKALLETVDHSIDSSILFRAALMTPSVYDSNKELKAIRRTLITRIENLHQQQRLLLNKLDEFNLSPTFYFAYQGYNDKLLLSRLHDAYALAYPTLIQSTVLESQKIQQYHKIRIGFYSAHFRRHSICKLFCNLILSLDHDVYDVFIYSSLNEAREDTVTRRLIDTDHIHFIRIGMPMIQNRIEVTRQNIDIMVTYASIAFSKSLSGAVCLGLYGCGYGSVYNCLGFRTTRANSGILLFFNVNSFQLRFGVF
jgi:predicted O-linked N-acetylglucosamine transferase (SPINDLY family)